MCLILFSYDDHPDYELVIAANRDEFYDRPAAQADFWQDAPGILAGRDLSAGGTWMGVSLDGKISMLTNYRDLRNIDPNAPSRGHLVSDYLKGKVSGLDYLRSIPDNGKAYNGYNIIAGGSDGLFYQSNYSKGVRKIEKGIHGLSNELLNSPWPKVEKGKKMLDDLLKNDASDDEILDAMYDDTVYPDNQLPDTGIGIEKERVLSSMFIKSPGYGSRCSTVIRVDRDGYFELHERTYEPGSHNYSSAVHRFKVQSQLPGDEV